MDRCCGMILSNSTALLTSEQLQKETIAADKHFLLWIPLHRAQTQTPTESIHFNRELTELLKELTQSDAVRIKQGIQTALQYYSPPFPTKTILFRIDPAEIRTIPLRYEIARTGIANGRFAWRSLLNNMELDPATWYIRLGSDRYELIESDPQKRDRSISLPIGTESRYVTIRRFISSVLRIYRNNPGPLVAIGNGDGIMELDCWILSSYLTVQSQINLSLLKRVKDWERSFERSGHTSRWIKSWIEIQIDTAKRRNKWADRNDDIPAIIKTRRVSAIINPSSCLEHLVNEGDLMFQLLTDQPNMYKCALTEPGIILR